MNCLVANRSNRKPATDCASGSGIGERADVHQPEGGTPNNPHQFMSTITSNPLDGAWVEQAARLYVSRYHSHLDYRPEADRNLERIRVTSSIRECLPAPERIDAQVPAIMREVIELRAALADEKQRAIVLRDQLAAPEAAEVIASERRMMEQYKHRYELQLECNSAAQNILRKQGWTWNDVTGWREPVKPENDPSSGRYVPLKCAND